MGAVLVLGDGFEDRTGETPSCQGFAFKWLPGFAWSYAVQPPGICSQCGLLNPADLADLLRAGFTLERRGIFVDVYGPDGERAFPYVRFDNPHATERQLEDFRNRLEPKTAEPTERAPSDRGISAGIDGVAPQHVGARLRIPI